MPGAHVSRVLRPGLLQGVTIMFASAPSPVGERLEAAMREACSTLGARLLEWPLDAGEQGLGELLRAGGPVDLLAVDAGGAFTAAAAHGSEEAARAALAWALRCSWEVTRAFALELIDRGRAGKVVLIAPAVARPDAAAGAGEQASGGAGQHVASYARAARAGLENLGRTLSIEWARHAITTVAIAPSGGTEADELAALCAYLASPAGAYFSGCVLPLGAVQAAPAAAAAPRP